MNPQLQIADDLGRKITDRLEEVLQREVDLARHVLSVNMISYMMLRIANGTTFGALLVAMQSRKDGTDPGEIFDVFERNIREMVLDSKPAALKILTQIEPDRTTGVGK